MYIQKNKDEKGDVAKGIRNALLRFSKAAGISLNLLPLKEW